MAYDRPPNPVNWDVFSDDEFKNMNKNFSKVAAATTGAEGGKMSMDPTQFSQQLVSFADAIEQQGWPLWGKEACRILWDLLSSKFKKVMATSKCYQVMQKEDFKRKNKDTPTGQYPGMMDTLRAHFGAGGNRRGLGTAASQDYYQGESEFRNKRGFRGSDLPRLFRGSRKRV